MSALPLLAGAALDAPIAWRRGRWIARAEYLAHAEALAQILPAGQYGLNLCEDRYYFMVALAALLLAGRTNLLPPSAAPRTIAEIETEYGAFRLADEDVSAVVPRSKHADFVPELPAAQEAAVLFTSGSTGRPVAQAKTWGELVGATAMALRRFDLGTARHDIVATVPSQHSYGFESSVLYALQSPAVVHAGQPLFPADVCAALAEMRAPRILVTTPLHLEVCLRSDLDWPPLAFTLSATAPLGRELAACAEHIFAAPLREIYGSSETGAIASRRTATESAWQPYDGVRLIRSGGEFRVQASHLPEARVLADDLALAEDGRFEWRGRKADQIKVAGKRSTLAELNGRLLAIVGVEDGGFVVPDAEGGRLAAVVVAPTLTAKQIRARLAETLDPVFLPRPLVKVVALKRTATGKLTRQELLAHLAAAAEKRSVGS
ncbi:MAG: AMP-binding protein [Gammaproteobacteria bacterium]